MKNFKKITAFVLSLLICIPSVTFAEYADINEGSLSEAIALFEDLGLISGYEDGYFRKEQGMIRADFAIMLAGLLGYTEERVYTEQHFDDVNNASTAYGSVEFLYEKGLINGIGSKIFAPDEPITYAQAVKIVMSALGYEIYAQAKGGYPNGYMSAAASAGVLTNVSGANVLTRGNACILLFNALTAPIMGYSMSDENITYAPDNTNTLLYDVLKISKHEGIFIADKSMSVFGSYSLENGDVIIDYTRYKTKLTNLSSMVGHNVKYYVNDETEEVISVYDDASEVITIDGDDIDGKTDVGTIYYDDGKRVKSYSIASDAFYVYNGRALPTITDDYFKNIYGSVTVINNDDDKEAEAVIIWNYTDHVVENYVSHSETIFTKSAGVSFNISDMEYRLTKNGSEIEPTELARLDIISVAQTDEIINIMASDTVVSGKLEGENTEDGEYIINGTVYEKGRSCKDGAELGVEYDFYLDVFGKIFYFEKSGTDNTAYLYSSFIDTDIDDNAAFSKVFTVKGNLETLEYADRVSVQNGNDIKVYDENDLISSLLKPNGENFDGLIQYELNANGEVSKLKLPKDVDFEAWNNDFFACNMNTAKMVEEGKLKVEKSNMYNNILSWTSGNTDDRQYTVRANQDSVVFNITKSQDTWSIKSLANYNNGAGFINCRLYDITKNGYVKYMLVYSDQEGADDEDFTYNDPIVIVKKKLKTINDDDEPCFSIVGMDSAGEEISYYIEDGELESNSVISMAKNMKFNDVSTGDVVQLKVDNYGNVESFRLLCKSNENPECFFNPYTSSFAIAPVSHGNVFFGPSEYEDGMFIYKNSSDMIKSYLDGTSDYPICILKHTAGGGAILYDRKTKDCTYLSAEECFGSEETFIYTYPGYGRKMVVVYQ